MAQATLAPPSIDGINLAGYLTGELGVGVVARGYVEAIKSLSLEIALNNVEVNLPSRKNDRSISGFAMNNPYPINIICVNADQLGPFTESYGEDYFKDKYNIGVWWWEVPEFPQTWWDRFKQFDELWVGSTYVQQALAKYSPIPVVTIPPVVLAPKKENYTKTYFGLPENEFVFLFMFDYWSVFERKNPLALIEAFKRAFKPGDPVRLVLKSVNAEINPRARATLHAAAQGANITFMEKYLSSSEKQGLMHACDCYASLHRSEGLGIPLAEAMLLRRPVIATAWSGNMDWMTINNSYLVPYQLVLNPDTAGPYDVAETWAEADVEAAARHMRSVFENTNLRDEKTAKAFMDATKHFSVESVASHIQSRLSAISTFRADGRPFAAQRPLVYRIRQTVERQLSVLDDGSRYKDQLYSSTNKFFSWFINPLRKFVAQLLMPYLNKQAEYNDTATQLIRSLLLEPSQTKTQVDMLEQRTRNFLAQADARIRELEQEIESLKGE